MSGTKAPKLLPGDLALTSGGRRGVPRSLWPGLGLALSQPSPSCPERRVLRLVPRTNPYYR